MVKAMQNSLEGLHDINTCHYLKMISEKRGKVIVFGCGGHARSIINTLHQFGLNIEIILVDDNAAVDEYILGCKVVQEYILNENDGYIVAIGDNARRKDLYNLLIDRMIGCCIAVVSRESLVGMEVQIGMGTFIAPHCYIGPQVKIGNNTIVNSGSVIEHEVMVGNHTHIAPHVTICGRTRIGDNVFCGAGSTVVDKIYICDNVIIGAGTVVKEDITKPGTYVGVPARKIK